MSQLKSSKFRKWVICLFLIVGIFPSIQAVFACEKIDDRIQFKSDCIQMDVEITPCAEIQDCNSNAINSDMTDIDSCCDSISHLIAHVRSTSHDTSLNFTLSLDEPPAILANFYTVNQTNVAVFQRLFIIKPTVFSASDIYLNTRRLRI